MEQCGLDGLTDLIAKPQSCLLMNERRPGGEFLWNMYESPVLKQILFNRFTNNLDKEGGGMVIKFVYDYNKQTKKN